MTPEQRAQVQLLAHENDELRAELEMGRRRMQVQEWLIDGYRHSDACAAYAIRELQEENEMLRAMLERVWRVVQ